MNVKPRVKREALVYLAAAIAGMILLGIGLANLRLQAGLPVPGAETVQANPSILQTSGEAIPVIYSWIFRGILALLVIGLAYLLVSSAAKSKSIPRIILIAAALLAAVALLGWLPISIPESSASTNGIVSQLLAPVPEYDIAPIGEPPANLFRWVAGILITAGTALGAWFLAGSLRRAHRPEPMRDAVDSAIQAIHGGQDLQNVIIRCYADMEGVVRMEQGIQRSESVTAREFEVYLSAKGIPAEPVSRLTRLFEQARYGNEGLTSEDEDTALASLGQIARACRGKRSGAL